MTGNATDDVVRATKRTKDERAWERERRAKRRTPPAPAVPDGPCCLRCRHWRPSLDADERFGGCRRLAVVKVRRGGLERGTVLAAEDAIRDHALDWEYLRTMPGFACRRWEAGGDAT